MKKISFKKLDNIINKMIADEAQKLFGFEHESFERYEASVKTLLALKSNLEAVMDSGDSDDDGLIISDGSRFKNLKNANELETPERYGKDTYIAALLWSGLSDVEANMIYDGRYNSGTLYLLNDRVEKYLEAIF